MSPITSPVISYKPLTSSAPSSSAKPTRKLRKERAPEPVTPVPPPKAAPKAAAAAPQASEILCVEQCELHLFDLNSNTFILQDQEVTATVSEVGRWECESPFFHLPPQ